MNYKKSYKPQIGYTPVSKLGESTLKDLEFGIIELNPAQRLNFNTKGSEVAFIMLEGKDPDYIRKVIEYGVEKLWLLRI